MGSLTLQDVHRSKVDKTRKLLYTLQRDTGPVTIEVGVIDKGDGKDILCIPSQTNCAQACRFCFTTEMAGKVEVENLTAEELAFIVKTAWLDAGLTESQNSLLVSFMGVGEPAANTNSLLRAMTLIKVWAFEMQLSIRFGLATMLPKKHLEDFRSFLRNVAMLKIPLKVHLSLHYPTSRERNIEMPAAAEVGESLTLLRAYRADTGQPIEIHYTLISGKNDFMGHAERLRSLLQYDPIPVKLLEYNPLPGDPHRSSDPEWRELFREYLHDAGIVTEYYASPGADIAAACGMFLTSAYIETQPNLRQMGQAIFQIIKDHPFPDPIGIPPLPPPPTFESVR